ncbi:MAG: peptide-methionine (S)-S-oxide reductase MsrA [Rhizobacter sp.]
MPLPVRRHLFALGAAALAGALLLRFLPAARAAPAALAPPPATEAPVAPGGALETAVFAGGCFWGLQAVFQHVDGVTSAVSGYAGGSAASARYPLVSSGVTGHAEAVRVVYDPRRIRDGPLMQIFFSVAHDPTQLNRQGPDHGTQYRSAVFPTTPAQAQAARAYITQLDTARTFGQPLATSVETDKTFHAAEAYHQDYLARNPGDRYIVVNDLPKLDDLKRLFPAAWRDKPVLVGQR